MGVLARAASLIADQQVRNRGTIGGSVAHGDPAADMPAVLLATDGEVTARGPDGERTIGAAELFTDLFSTALSDDEILTEVSVPALAGWGWGDEKFSRRREDWAIVGVAVADGGAGVSLVNMGSTPVRASAVEAALGDGASAADAAVLAAEGLSPPEDLNGDAVYRSHLARVLTERALLAAGIA